MGLSVRSCVGATMMDLVAYHLIGFVTNNSSSALLGDFLQIARPASSKSCHALPALSSPLACHRPQAESHFAGASSSYSLCAWLNCLTCHRPQAESHRLAS